MGMPDLGRFSDPSILILASLAGGKKHGYAIMEDIEAMARVRLGTGTLYGAIARLRGARAASLSPDLCGHRLSS
jgi:DNA-binding PadR family transcriptional regulator